jgi:single-strand DNA-binding protein
MNEMTIHGNLTSNADPIRYSAEGKAAVTFSVAVNRRRYDRQTGQWTDLNPIFHRVVAFGALAENAANLAKGTAVTVTGELADDSWTPEDGKRVYRTQLIAADIAVSLRFATATVTKNPRRDSNTNRELATAATHS